MSSNKPEQTPNGPQQEQQAGENAATFFRSFLQDVVCFAVLLTLGLLILSLFFFVVEDLTYEVKPPVRKNCRWPAEWCEMIWYCQRNQTELEMHRAAQHQRQALARAKAQKQLALNYEDAMNMLG